MYEIIFLTINQYKCFVLKNTEGFAINIMKYRILILPLLALLISSAFSSCSSFVMEEDSNRLRAIERSNGNSVNYVMLHDVERNGVVLKRGTAVRIVIVVGDDWIKVYAYDSSQPLLEAKRLLVLYVFKDEFPDEVYKEELFRQKLAEVLVRR